MNVTFPVVTWVSGLLPAPAPAELRVGAVRESATYAEIADAPWSFGAPVAVVDLYWPDASRDGLDVLDLLRRKVPIADLVVIGPADARLRHHFAEAYGWFGVRRSVRYGSHMSERVALALEAVRDGVDCLDEGLGSTGGATLHEMMMSSLPLRRTVRALLDGVATWTEIDEDHYLSRGRTKKAMSELFDTLQSLNPDRWAPRMNQTQFALWVGDIQPYLESWIRRHADLFVSTATIGGTNIAERRPA